MTLILYRDARHRLTALDNGDVLLERPADGCELLFSGGEATVLHGQAYSALADQLGAYLDLYDDQLVPAVRDRDLRERVK